MSLFIFTIEILGICVLLCLSAFFSGSETAFFSLRKWRVERLKRSGVRGSAIAELLANPKGLIATILIGNETVNIAASNLAAIIRRDYFSAFGTAGLMVALIATTFLIFIFGEVTPKSIAIYTQERWALSAATPMRFLFKALFPVRIVVENITNRFDSRFTKGSAKSREGMSIGELRTIVEESSGESGLTGEEVKTIGSIFDLNETPVKNMMIPRPRIAAISENATLDEALSIGRKTRFSRFPVFGEDMDDIKGVMYAKELLSLQFSIDRVRSLRDIIRPALFIPETKSAFEVLKDFQKNHIHLAVVLDEYGGTAGIVTIDDIFREIVGDTGDKMRPLKHRFEKLADGAIIMDGSTSLEEFNEISGGEIEDPDVETIAGYVVKMMGRIPSEGEELRSAGFSFRVLKMLGKRIAVIEVRRTGTPSGAADG